MSQIRKYLVTYRVGSITVRATCPQQARIRAATIKRILGKKVRGQFIKVERA